MPDASIRSVSTYDARFPLPPGAGTDSVHTNSEYSFAVTSLAGENGLRGTGIALTLGNGNKLVCEAIEMLAKPLAGSTIEELMADFGRVSRKLADDPSLRWLGPHKGVVHLALASITNACFDLWAKSRCKPLWKLLLDLAPSEVVRLLDLSYLEEVLSEQDAIELLQGQLASRNRRIPILQSGYPGYDTSVGWMAYDVHGHAVLAREIAPTKIAAGEHIPNRVVFKNFMQASALHYVQADCTRLAGVSEFLTVSLLAKKFSLPVVPHVGDMGQVHQHLVLFNHIALGHELSFLEHIPHLRSHFVFPASVADG